MNCWKCNKEMEKFKLIGVEVKVQLDESQKTKENIDYYNKQLGKYSNREGECDVAICYECYIDGLFNQSNLTLMNK